MNRQYVYLVAYTDDDGPYAAAFTLQASAQAFANEVDGVLIYTEIDNSEIAP